MEVRSVDPKETKEGGGRSSTDKVGIESGRGRGLSRSFGTVKLFNMYDTGESTGEVLLKAFRGAEEWTEWSRGQATRCLRSGIADVGEKWRGNKRGAGVRLRSRCIRGG